MLTPLRSASIDLIRPFSQIFLTPPRGRRMLLLLQTSDASDAPRGVAVPQQRRHNGQPSLARNLENHFELDRGAQRKACDAIHQAARVLVFSEDVLQQLRSAVSDFRLIADISRSGH